MRTLLFLIVLVPALAGANECRFSAQRDFDVDAAGLRTLALALGSTDVVVEGVPGLAKVEVRGRACASEQAWLDALTVAQQRTGDRLVVTPNERHDIDWLSGYAYIDLHVRVPSTFGAEIKSRSSDAQVRHLAALDFNTSSGDLRVADIAGMLALKVSSGDVNGDGIGAVEVRATSSGDINLRDVRGDVRVTRAGSGDLQFDKVGGVVAIGRVGSGDVTLSGIGGDVTVESIGSGDLDVDDVGGDFTLGRQGSGELHQRNVRGKVSVPQRDD